MPYDDPEPDDPHALVGVVLPADEESVRDMAAAFADEFARMGLEGDRIEALFRNPFYRAPHAAWRALGEREIARMVGESIAAWGRCRSGIQDAPAGLDEHAPPAAGPLVGPGGRLRVVERLKP